MADANYFSPESIIKTQREFMDSWLDMAQQGMNKNADGSDKKPSAANSDAQEQLFGNWQDFFTRMADASQSYFSMAERFAGLSKDGMTTQQVCADWVEQMSSVFTQAMNQPTMNLDDLAKDPAAFWDMPHDTWNRTFSTLFPFPGDVFRAFRPEGLNRAPGDVHGHLDQFLATPSIGYTRESQDQYKKLYRLMLDYQKGLNDYNAAMAKVGMEALAAFQYRLTKEAGTDEKATSFKELYDLWTKVSEEVYGAYVMTEEYTEMYGRLVNKMMAVKQQTAKMVDEFCESLNMPTRKEVNTLHKRVQEVRRNFDKHVANEVEELKERIEALESQLSGKKKKTKTAAEKKPAAKKSAVKKTTTKKPAVKKAPVKKKLAAKKTISKKAPPKKTTKKPTTKKKGK